MQSLPHHNNQPSRITVRAVDVGAARRYLLAIERVARHGRTSADPLETLAALRTLARPTGVLRDLAGEPAAAVLPPIDRAPFNLTDAELAQEWERS